MADKTPAGARIKLRRGTTTAIKASTYVPAAGEPVFDTVARTLRIGDGSTQLKSLESIAATSETEATTKSCADVSI